MINRNQLVKIEEKVRACQRDILESESGKTSLIAASRHSNLDCLSNLEIEDWLGYRAFPPSQDALDSYEEVVSNFQPDLLFDIGSGVGTGTLSLCLAALKCSGNQPRILCVEPDFEKRYSMFEYLDYCDLTRLVRVIEDHEISSYLGDDVSSCLAFIDCWPRAIPSYLRELSLAPSSTNLAVVFEMSTGGYSTAFQDLIPTCLPFSASSELQYKGILVLLRSEAQSAMKRDSSCLR